MTHGASVPVLRSPARGVAVWCGWVLVAAAVLIPLTGWLAPRQLASVMAVVGVLCLPSVRIAATVHAVAATLDAESHGADAA